MFCWPCLAWSLGGVHLAGGVLGVLRHVLHTVGHLVDGGRDQLHLLGLLLAMALSFAGNIAEIARGLIQRAGRLEHLTDNVPQLVGEGIEVGGQCGEFIAAMSIEITGQVAFAAGDVGHGVDRCLQRLHDTAGNDDHQPRQQHGDQKADGDGFQCLSLELCLYIIDIDTGANDPAPGLEQLDIGNLRYRVTGAWLRPAVIDLAGTLAAGDGDHLVEQRLAVRV